MSDFNRNNTAARRDVGSGRIIATDADLRAYMIRVYNYMALGVVLTGIVAWLTFQAEGVTDANGTTVELTPFGHVIFGGPAIIVLMLGTFGLVMFISLRIEHLQPATARVLFGFCAALLGLMLSSIFLTYTSASVTRVFLSRSMSTNQALVRWGRPESLFDFGAPVS